MTRVRIGTCSFADEALVQAWYPRGTRPPDRLPYYAGRYDTVEVDSTYYRLPDEATAARWAERTPDGFTIHVKAFGMMTRHPVRVEQLPPDLRDAAATDARGRVERPSRELRAEVFARFRAALAPLREAGRLGGILLQLPPYVVFRRSSLAYLEWARDQLPGETLLVEFRHASWLDDGNREQSLRFLEQHGLAYVTVDAPRSATARNLVPTVVAATAPVAYVRFHGRNLATWNRRGGGAAERFDYLYSEEELREWVEPLRELAAGTDAVYAFFNNNSRSPDPRNPLEVVAQAPTNAAMLRRILDAAGVAASGGLE